MNLLLKSAPAVCAFALPLLAGALLLKVDNPNANPEALKRHAVLVVQISACRSPEKTSVSATAEGVLNGVRHSVPLKVISLSTAGTYAVTREWPEDGSWAIKMVATNPDYANYATSVIVPVRKASVQWSEATSYFHAPTASEISLAIN